MSDASILSAAIVTAVRRHPLPLPPDAALPADAQVTFDELAREINNEQERQRIWRDDLLARLEPQHAAERHRLLNVWAALGRMVERVRDDKIILARLRELKRIDDERQAALDAAANPDGPATE